MSSRSTLRGLATALALSIAAPAVASDEDSPGLLDAGLMGWLGSGAQGGEGEDGGLLDSISFSGSVDVAFTYNWNNSKTTFPENLRIFDQAHNEFSLQNVILTVEREANEDNLIGFNVTPSFGVDGGNATLGGGLNFGGEDMDLLEGYISAYVPDSAPVLGGATVKIGKFYTTAGAEVIPSYQNAMFSRTFNFGIALPFTHTGVLVEYPLIEREDGGTLAGIHFGWTNGWDAARDSNDAHNLITGATLSPMDWCALSANWFWSPALDRGLIGDNNSQANLLNLVADFRLPGMEDISFLGEFNWYGDEDEAGGVIGAGYADYYGFAAVVKWDFANPLTADAAKNLYVAMRGEFLDDADGYLANLFGIPVPGGPAPVQVWDLTWTLGWRPADAFLVRFEVRLDKADDRIFEDGTRSSQTTMAVNTVFNF